MSKELKVIKFACTKCGVCCNKIIMKTELGQTGMYLQVDERHLFPPASIKPMYAVGLKGRARPRPKKIVAYQFAAEPCPHYDEKVGCTIYDTRPNICRSFPLEVNLASRQCPIIESTIADGEGFRFEPESVKVEREANKKHIEYLMKFKKQKLGDEFWVWTLDKQKWLRVKQK
jgi:Fe-S-cluster containining protein